MKSSIESSSPYAPDSTLDSSVVRKIIDLNQSQEFGVQCTTLHLGGTFQVPSGMRRVVEKDYCGDLIIVRSFIKWNGKVYFISEKIKSKNGIFVYVITQGVAELIQALDHSVSVTSLRDCVNTIITEEIDWLDYTNQLDAYYDPIYSNIDNEGSSIYDNVDSFNTKNLEASLFDSIEYGDSYVTELEEQLNYLFGEGTQYLYRKDIIAGLDRDELFTTGVIGAKHDILTGEPRASRVLRQLSNPSMIEHWDIDVCSSLRICTPVMTEKDNLLCMHRPRPLRTVTNVIPIQTFSVDLMDWLRDIHRLVFVGRFRYILPKGETVNYAHCYPDTYLKDPMFQQVMSDFKMAFASLIDFSTVREIEISVTPTEELFITVKCNNGTHYTLYADFILVSIISLGLIREQSLI